MAIENILVIMHAYPEHLAQLEKAAPGAHVIRQSVKMLTHEQVAAADVIVGNLPAEFLPSMKRARLLQLNSAGVGAAYLALEKTAPHTVLCCASGAYGVAISEYMLGVLMMLLKRLHQYRDGQRLGAWTDRGDVRSPRDMKVLVLGLGDIGTRFAQLMNRLGAQVTGIRRRVSAPPEGVERVAAMDELDSLLPWADVVALSLPETQDTLSVMNSDRFALMKQGSYLINVGRGSAVDQDALLEALRGGRLAGAAIDVTSPEPLPSGHPLWQEENLILTPHISGAYHLRLTQDTIFDIAAANIRALPEGPFTSRVDYKAGYRA